MQYYSKPISEKLQEGFSIYNKVNDLKEKKFKSLALKNQKEKYSKSLKQQKKKVKAKIEYFNIPEQEKILFDNRDSIKPAYQKIENLNDIENYLCDNKNSKSSIYLKNLKNYKSKIKRFKKKLHPEKLNVKKSLK